MKSINFRVWDGKELHYPNSQEGGSTRFLTLRDNFFLYGSKGEFITSSFHSAIIQISTSLKDKNGVEIFEGDILRFDPHKTIAFVIHDGFRFGLKSIGSEAVDYEEPIIYKQAEVVGKIYSNPKNKLFS